MIRHDALVQIVAIFGVMALFFWIYLKMAHITLSEFWEEVFGEKWKRK